MPPRADPETLAALRARVGALAPGRPAVEAVPIGAAAVDAALPWGGLPVGCLHEIAAAGGPDSGAANPAAAAGFAAALLARFAARRPGPVLWCLRHDDLYPPGLRGFGLDPDRLLVARARRSEEVLWVLEEGLRCGALAAVLGEAAALDLTASRRLQLAAAATGTPCLLLRGAGGDASVAVTRWRLAPAPTAGGTWVGAARWHVVLARCRGGGGLRDWLMDWDDETHRFAVVPALGDRTAGPEPLRRAG